MRLLNDLLLQTSPSAILAVSLIKATIVLTIIQLFVSALPRLSAATKHFLLTAGLASFLIIPLLAFAAPKWTVAVPAGAEIKSAQQPRSSVTHSGSVSEERPPAGPTSTPAEVPQSSTLIDTLRELSMGQIAGIVWLLVSCFLTLRLVRSSLRLRTIVQEAHEPSQRILALLTDLRDRLEIDSPVRVLQSEAISVPMMWGLRKGTLLLPAIADAWTDEELRATLIHELGHLQRLDYATLTLMNVVSALLWFHPQVWTARQWALTEGERACDDLVLRAGERASEYASHLLHVARLMDRRDAPTALLAMSRPSQLEGRMYAILSTSVNRQAIGGKILMTGFTLFMAVVTPLSMFQLSIQPATASATPHGSVLASMGVASSVFSSIAEEGHVAEEISASASHESEIQGHPPVPPAPPALPHPSERRHRGLSTNSGREITSCADYNYEFGDGQVGRAEEQKTYAGNRLSVTAARNGGITLRRSTSGAFTIETCKAAGGSSSGEVSRILSQISVQERNGAITVDGPENASWTVNFIIGVPDGHSVALRAHNGPISVRGINANVEADVVNGPLTLDNSRGDFRVNTKNGPVAISKMAGNIEATVKNGPLTVRLDDGWVGGELRASVENGPLAVTLPRNYGGGVQVKSRGHGPFACSLPECRSIMANEENGPPSWAPKEVNIGSGPARVFLQGGNGPISIRQAN